MTLETTVRVTADHIADGEPGEPCGCPIAMAILDAIGNPDDLYTRADVFTESAWLRTEGASYRTFLPQSAQDFIGRYDNALPVEPFEFALSWES